MVFGTLNHLSQECAPLRCAMNSQHADGLFTDMELALAEALAYASGQPGLTREFGLSKSSPDGSALECKTAPEFTTTING